MCERGGGWGYVKEEGVGVCEGGRGLGVCEGGGGWGYVKEREGVGGMCVSPYVLHVTMASPTLYQTSSTTPCVDMIWQTYVIMQVGLFVGYGWLNYHWSLLIPQSCVFV